MVKLPAFGFQPPTSQMWKLKQEKYLKNWKCEKPIGSGKSFSFPFQLPNLFSFWLLISVPKMARLPASGYRLLASPHPWIKPAWRYPSITDCKNFVIYEGKWENRVLDVIFRLKIWIFAFSCSRFGSKIAVLWESGKLKMNIFSALLYAFEWQEYWVWNFEKYIQSVPKQKKMRSWGISKNSIGF